jgi:hypothetical protein
MPLVAGNLPLSASNLVTFSDAHMPDTLFQTSTPLRQRLFHEVVISPENAP